MPPQQEFAHAILRDNGNGELELWVNIKCECGECVTGSIELDQHRIILWNKVIGDKLIQDFIKPLKKMPQQSVPLALSDD